MQENDNEFAWLSTRTSARSSNDHITLLSGSVKNDTSLITYASQAIDDIESERTVNRKRAVDTEETSTHKHHKQLTTNDSYKHKKEKKEKKSKDKKSKRGKISHEYHQLIPTASTCMTTSTSKSLNLPYQHVDDNNFEDSDEETRIDISDIPIGSEVVHLPNGNILIKEHGSNVIENEDYTFDKRGDKEVLATGSFYRGDIPKYNVHDGDKYISSAEIARQAYVRPSEATILSSTHTITTNKTQANFVPISHRIAVKNKDSNRMSRIDRYYLPSKNFLISSTSLSADTIYRTHNQQPMKSLVSLGTGSGFIPIIPYSSYVDEVQALKRSSSEDNTIKTSDMQMYQSMAMDLARDLNTATRSSQLNPGIAWLRLIQEQNRLHKLQMLGSGDRSHILIEWYPLERRYIIDKKLSLCEDAIAKITLFSLGNDELQSSAIVLVYQYYLLLAAAYSTPDHITKLWQQAMISCPLSYKLRLDNWHYLCSASSKDQTISMLRNLHLTSYHQAINQLQNLEAARLFIHGISTSVMSSLHVSSSNGIDPMLTVLPMNLQLDVESYHIDSLAQLLHLEVESGYLERAIALVQALLDMNLSGYDHQHNDDVEKYWESEYPRLGESDDISSCGLSSWRKQGRVDDEVTSWNALVIRLYESGIDINHKHIMLESEADTNNIILLYNEPEAVVESIMIDNVHPPDINSKRKRAVDFFFEASEQETNEAINSRGFNDPSTLAMKDDEDDNDIGMMQGYKMVYSRIHGYRIPMPMISIPDQAYNRALQTLKPSLENDNQYVNITIAATANNNGTKVTANHINEKLRRSYQHRYQREIMLMNIQHRPLRVYAEADMDACANQPLRVILYEDIKPYLAYFAQPSSLIRLVVRMLESLGIYAPFSESSSSYHSWHHMQSSASLSRGSCNFLSAVLSASTSPTSLMTPNLQLYTSYLTQSITNVDVILHMLQHQPLVADHDTLLSHVITKSCPMTTSSHELDSKLDFLLQLISCLSQQGNKHMPLSCIQALQRGYMALLTQRYEVDKLQHRISSADALISSCKQIVQRSESQANIVYDNMSLWSTYLRIEAMHGQHTTAWKVADKLLSAIQAHTSSSITPVDGVSHRGYDLLLTIVHLALGLISDSTISSPIKAIAIIVDVVNQAINPSSSYLRHDKKQTSLQRFYRPPQQIASTITTLQDLIIISINSIISQLVVAKSVITTESSIHATRMYVPSIPSIDSLPKLYYLIAITSWLLCLADHISAADQFLVAIIHQLLNSLVPDHPWTSVIHPVNNQTLSSSFFAYPNISTESSLSYLLSTQPIISTLCASNEGASTLILIESLCRLRLELHAFMYKHRFSELGIQQAKPNNNLSMLMIIIQGLILFPLNTSFLVSLWAIESQRAGGYLRMKHYLSFQQKRLIYGNSLTPIEFMFRLFIEVSHASFRARDEAILLQSYDLSSTPSTNHYYLHASAWLPDDRKHLLRICEDMVHDPYAQTFPWLWRFYLQQQGSDTSIQPHSRAIACKKLFYRSIRRCGMNKLLWIEAWNSMSHHVDDNTSSASTNSDREIKDMEDIMHFRGIHPRTELS